LGVRSGEYAGSSVHYGLTDDSGVGLIDRVIGLTYKLGAYGLIEEGCGMGWYGKHLEEDDTVDD
jgi:hypothetical protein